MKNLMLVAPVENRSHRTVISRHIYSFIRKKNHTLANIVGNVSVSKVIRKFTHKLTQERNPTVVQLVEKLSLIQHSKSDTVVNVQARLQLTRIPNSQFEFYLVYM